MCGINGIAFSGKSGRAENEDVWRKMRGCLEHRYRDDFGVISEKNPAKDYNLQLQIFTEDLRIRQTIESAKTGMPFDINLEAILENKDGAKSSAAE